MRYGASAPRVLHFRTLRRHAEPFVKMGVKHFHALFVQTANHSFTRVPFIVSARVYLPAPAADDENVGLVAAPGVDQVVLDSFRPGERGATPSMIGSGSLMISPTTAAPAMLSRKVRRSL